MLRDNIERPWLLSVKSEKCKRLIAMPAKNANTAQMKKPGDDVFSFHQAYHTGCSTSPLL